MLSVLLALSVFPTFVIAASDDRFAGFPQPQADFSAHTRDVETYLLNTQMDQRSAADVKYNLPFEKRAKKDVAYRGKFLLIHGLNDSPYVWSDVAIQLSDRGFDVRGILLPGHGNTPEAQLDMSFKQWINASRDHLTYWAAGEDTPMYLGGFSMGGVIATTLALENTYVDGLLLFSPAFKSQMHHLLRWSSLYSLYKPWVFGGMIIEDNPAKYNSIPINGAAQYYKSTQYLHRTLRGKSLSIPTLMVASLDDSVVDVDHLAQVFKRKFSADTNKLLLYTNDEYTQSDESVVVRGSAYPERRILNQSHQSVLLSEKNALYGRNGTALVCNGNDWPTFSACLYSSEEHWFGAQHTPSPDGVPVARTTYNPDFDSVLQLFDEVFNLD